MMTKQQILGSALLLSAGLWACSNPLIHQSYASWEEALSNPDSKQGLQVMKWDGEAPETVPAFSDVRFIRIWDCPKTTRIPSGFASSPKLEHISIRDCPITTLPEDLFQGPALTEVELYIPLSKLPQSLLESKTIESLTLWGLDMAAIPEEIGLLPKLHTLNIENTKDGHSLGLPESLKKNKTLKTLQLWSKNETIPNIVFEISQLEELAIRSDKLSSVPADLAKLQNLKRLELVSSSLEQLPEVVYELKNLEILLYNSTTTKVDKEKLKQLTKLKQ